MFLYIFMLEIFGEAICDNFDLKLTLWSKKRGTMYCQFSSYADLYITFSINFILMTAIWHSAE